MKVIALRIQGDGTKYPVPQEVYKTGYSGVHYVYYLQDYEIDKSIPLPDGSTLVEKNHDAPKLTEAEIEYIYKKAKDRARRTWKHAVLNSADPDSTIFALCIIIGTLIPDGKLWGCLVGPPSTGKTTILNWFRCLEEKRIVKFISGLSSARLLSTQKGDDASPLFQVKDGGTIIMKDVSGLLASYRMDFMRLVGFMRMLYDDEGVTYQNYGNKAFEYNGKVGFLLAATPEIHQIRKFQANLGERFLYMNVEHKKKMTINNVDFSWIASSFVPDSIDDYRIDTFTDVAQVAEFMAVMRSSDVEAIEAPYRIERQLRTLFAAARFCGFADEIVRHVFKRLVQSNTLREYMMIASCEGGSKKDYWNAVRTARSRFDRAFQYMMDVGLVKRISKNEYETHIINPVTGKPLYERMVYRWKTKYPSAK